MALIRLRGAGGHFIIVAQVDCLPSSERPGRSHTVARLSLPVPTTFAPLLIPQDTARCTCQYPTRKSLLQTCHGVHRRYQCVSWESRKCTKPKRLATSRRKRKWPRWRPIVACYISIRGETGPSPEPQATRPRRLATSRARSWTCRGRRQWH